MLSQITKDRKIITNQKKKKVDGVILKHSKPEWFLKKKKKM